MATFEEFTKKHLKKDQNRTAVNASRVRDGDSFTDFTKKRLGLSSDTSAEADDGKRTWFQAGALSDGYKFGDVLRSVHGTVDDIQESTLAGILGMGEQVVDAGAYLLGGAGSLFGADEFADSIKEFIAGDLYDERKVANVINYILHPDSILADSDNSFLGDKSDSLLQSAGQLAGTAGLQALGVPWWLTTGITSFGGEVDNAFDQGASYSEAGGSALISAGAEVLLEKLSGGIKFGGKTLDDILLKPLVDKIGNKVGRTLINFGIDVFGEGGEELLSSVFSRLGSNLYKREDIAKLLTSEEAMDEYLESFIGGAVLSGAGNISKVQGSLKTGRDYRTGLTDVEKKVFDKEYEQRISGAEDGGKKLSGKEKSKIYDEVMEDLKSGGIDIGVIEEVLGGDSYKSYKTAIDEEATLRKEFEELGKKERPTLADQSRYTELNERIKALEKDSGREVLKQKYEKEAYELSKGGYLAESYNERTRSKQAFKADLTKYTEKERAVVQRAIDSGLLNDTRKAHNFVDFVAKMCADQGIGFDFTSNERLKKSGFGIEGRTVDGYVTKDGITVNLNSAKALNKVVGHELTHVLEGTELYGSLRDSVFEYASVKGELDGKRKALEKLYEGIEGADIDSELTADLIGDYVFRDTDFISTLSRRHRNIFQRLYDEIKHLCKLATAGSKEARELEKVKRAFEKAYREGGKEHTDDSDALKHREDAKDEGSPAEEAPAEPEDKPIQVSDTETITPQQAQALNIMASTIISEARNNNISLEQYYAATAEVNAYSPTKAEVLTIADALEPIARQLGNENYSSYIDAIRAYAEDGGDNKLSESYGVSYSLDEIIGDSGKNYGIGVRLDSNLLTNLTDEERIEMVKEYVKELGGGVFTAYDGNQNPVDVHIVEYSKKFKNKSGKRIPVTKDLRSKYIKNKVKQESIALVDELLITSTYDAKKSPGYPHDWIDNYGKNDWEYWTTYLQDKDNNIWRATLNIANAENGEKILYDINPIKKVERSVKSDTISTDNIIPQTPEKVNRKNSISETFPDDFPIRSDLGSDIYGKDVALEFPIRKDIAGNNVDAEADSVPVSGDAGKNVTREDVQKRTDEIFNTLKEAEIGKYFKLGDYNVLITRNAGRGSADVIIRNSDGKRTKESISGGNGWSDNELRLEAAKILSDLEYPEMARDRNNVLLARKQQSIDNWLKEAKSKLDEEYDLKSDEITNSKAMERLEAEYQRDLERLEHESEKKKANAERHYQAEKKEAERVERIKEIIGNTAYWVDKKLGLSYKTNTLRRNLRDVVRDENGKRDIVKADAIYDALQGKYNHNESNLNRESNLIKTPYAEMKFTKAEDAYIQMLGEFHHNPDTTLTKEVVEDFYNKHKDSIDVAKVNKAINMARDTYDSLLKRVNEVLREQGMKEIPYRKGYFPHFTEDKQSFLAKLLNWNTQNNNIPTDIAGLTEQFKPKRSWQSFNKQRSTDITDYSFSKGLDTYVQGALDWIYHIEDIQNRRTFENYLRYIHSDQGIKDQIDAITQNEEYDADDMQEQIDLVYKEARNPLNNFVTDLRAGTNRLANKKSSMDRGMEELANRKSYSVMTNLSNRVSANMVGGSLSSAFTNFIPITQSWGQVSPVSSLRAMGETIRSAFKNDGTVDKSDFLTNRLNKAENLYKTTWDKIGNVVGFFTDIFDNFTSQTVWRSKYRENLQHGMSENEAIKDADQFAENVIGGRSRGNNPTIFDSKNPFIKIFTAFQLEVNNQYGYMLKDMPQDMRNESKAKLVKGYATMFIGAYVYNALYSWLTGRDAAFDPVGIIEELLGDLFDDEEDEPTEAIMNLADNVVEELPFIGGLMGGGRNPISSALPYDGNFMDMLEGTTNLFAGKNKEAATKEWMKPLFYLALPMGGGQINKTLQGLSMFAPDKAVSGSYTDSGGLRYPVEATPGNIIQAGVFGPWANGNAQQYIDEGRTPLNEKQVEELDELGIPIAEYWDYLDGLRGLSKLSEKADYIAGLDLTTKQKNLLINNIAGRKEPIDMSDYGDYGSFEEFDFAHNNPEKYLVARAVGGYDSYVGYMDAISGIKTDKDEDGKAISGSRKKKVIKYLNLLKIDYAEKLILFKSTFKGDDTYNSKLIEGINDIGGLSDYDKEALLESLGFEVDDDGNVTWD